jgi:virulence-associated protein VapD
MATSKKAINFDLDTKQLKKYYPNGDYHKAYYDIKSFLERNGFHHQQGSGYISDKPMTMGVAHAKLEKMNSELSWLGKCLKCIELTNANKKHNVISMFETSDLKNSKIEKVELEEYEEEISYSRRR